MRKRLLGQVRRARPDVAKTVPSCRKRVPVLARKLEAVRGAELLPVQ